jgi:hypothetical protein
LPAAPDTRLFRCFPVAFAQEIVMRPLLSRLLRYALVPAVLLAAVPARADIVRVTFSGSTAGSSPQAIAGTFTYDSTCNSGGGSKHIYHTLTNALGACTNGTHLFTLSQPASDTYKMNTPKWYEIDMSAGSGAAFTLHCITDGGNTCTITLTYATGVSPPPGGALPTLLNTADFQSMTITMAANSGAPNPINFSGTLSSIRRAP